MAFKNYDKKLYNRLGFLTVNMEGSQAVPRKYLNQALDVALRNIKRRLPKGATGRLSQAPRKQITKGQGGDLLGTIIVPDSSPASAYAYYAEYGRRPGKMPPFGKGSALYLWVEKKLIHKIFRTSGKTPRKTPSRDRVIASVTFAIAKTIGEKGTFSNPDYPLPMAFQKGWEESELEVTKILQYAMLQGI